MNKATTPIVVLGAGSWGTALAITLARNGQPTRLWGRDADQIQTMQAKQANEYYLPGVVLPDNLALFSDLSAALKDVVDIVVAVPSHAFVDILIEIKPMLNKDARIVWACKGLVPVTGQLFHEVAREIFTDTHALAVLSGPSFALEVANGLPTAVTVAATQETFARDLVQRFHCQCFRVYTSHDMIGVEISGAVKNSLAVAAGICDGLGFGANARSALITRGLVEMTRLGLALGGKRDTFTGLAGLGDLVLTCTDNQSRNRRFGLALGHGKSIKQAQAEIGQVIEAIANTAEIFQLAQRHQVEMPIVEQIYHVLHYDLTPQEAVRNLMSRDPKAEV